VRTKEIGTLAAEQLNAWRRYALRWHMRLEIKATAEGHKLGPGREQWHMVCAGYPSYDGPEWQGCGQTIMVMHDGANGYDVTETDIRTFLVDHLRRVHLAIEPTVYRGESWQNQT
jgi:hypothetical protein